MLHPITRLTAAALLAATCAASAQDARPFAADPELADLPDRWREIMPLFDVPGAAVVVVKDGQIYIETFGVRSVEAEPVTPDTIFYIASITKTYLATAVCMLEASGKLSLDDTVKDHLPRFELADDEAENSITIRDLLTHAAGLTSGENVMLDA